MRQNRHTIRKGYNLLICSAWEIRERHVRLWKPFLSPFYFHSITPSQIEPGDPGDKQPIQGQLSFHIVANACYINLLRHGPVATFLSSNF